MRHFPTMFVVLGLVVAPGCMCYFTPMEMGCKRLWHFDLEAVPTGQNPTTTPLTPHHHSLKKTPPLEQLPAPKASVPAEVWYIQPAPEKAAKNETSAPPVAQQAQTVPLLTTPQ